MLLDDISLGQTYNTSHGVSADLGFWNGPNFDTSLWNEMVCTSISVPAVIGGYFSNLPILADQSKEVCSPLGTDPFEVL